MKKVNKILFDFFEGTLSKNDKDKLLKDIENNASLKEDFENLYNLYSLLEKSKNSKPSEEYLNSILYRFRDEKSKLFSKFNPLYAGLAFSILILFSFVTFYLFDKGNFNDNIIGESYEEMKEFQFDNYNEIYDFIDKDYIDELLLVELTENGNQNYILESILDSKESLEYLNNKLTEEIYQELIKIKIL